MENYNIITLGTSGAGKTVFLGSLFKQLSTQGEKGFFLEVADSQKRKELTTIYSQITTGENWPAGTRNVTDWTFTCCVKNSDLDTYPVCQFTYVDYPGGMLTDIDNDEDNLFDFQEKVSKANAVLVIIDGLQLYKFMKNQNQGKNNVDVTKFLQIDLSSLMTLLNQCRKQPVHFIISKWDLLEGDYKLSEIKESLQKNCPEFDNVVRSRIKAGCPMRLIPISSIGKEFATLQSDGSMKKNPHAIPTPFQVEVPLACVLIDGLKVDMKTLGLDKEDIQKSIQTKTKLNFLDQLIQAFFKKGSEILAQDKEECLKEVKNNPTAINYLVGIFLEHLQKFEKDFPKANLGGQIPFPAPPVTPSRTTLGKAILTRTLTGHQKMVRSVGFSSDSQIIFSASHDKSIRFWQVASGKLQGIVYETSGFVLANLSKDNQLLFTTSEDNSIKVWNANTRKRLHKWKAHSDLINGFVVSPDGRTLISGSRDKTVKVWQLDAKGGQLIHTLTGHQGFIYALAVSPDWRIVASGSGDKTVLLWELNTGKLLYSLDKHPGFIRAVAFSPDGKTLVSGGFDKTVYVWDWKAQKLQYKLEAHTGAILSLAISPDNRILASGSEDCKINLFDLSTGTLVNSLTGHARAVTTLAFSPDNQTLASGSDDNTLKIWQLI